VNGYKETKSEVLFLEYCKLRGYFAKRICPPQNTGRFPDYELLIGDSVGIVVEIKELNPNPEDEREAKAMKERSIEAFGDEPGRRVRTHIEDAERQLRRYEGENIPTLVLLYDNIVVDGFRVHPPDFCIHPLAPYNIDVGMYGLQVANVRLHPGGQTESLGDTRGGKRTLRREHRANISAVAVLYDYAPDYGLFLIVYHNFYAKVPLPKSLFSHPKDHQMEKLDPEASPGPWELVRR
jgi:hypothetical protein